MDNSPNNSKKNNSLGIVLSEGETVVQDLKKHPIGVAISLIVGALLIVTILGITFFIFSLMQSSGKTNSGAYGSLVVFAGVIIAIGIAVATAVNVYLFRMDSLIVTTDKIAQIEYKTIFDRKVVQLSIERVQDVTVSQIGILPRIFKYGTITIDTAGENEDCIFSFAPNPYENSRMIMDIHEKAVAKSRSII